MRSLYKSISKLRTELAKLQAHRLVQSQAIQLKKQIVQLRVQLTKLELVLDEYVIKDK